MGWWRAAFLGRSRLQGPALGGAPFSPPAACAVGERSSSKESKRKLSQQYKLLLGSKAELIGLNFADLFALASFVDVLWDIHWSPKASSLSVGNPSDRVGLSSSLYTPWACNSVC